MEATVHDVAVDAISQAVRRLFLQEMDKCVIENKHGKIIKSWRNGRERSNYGKNSRHWPSGF